MKTVRERLTEEMDKREAGRNALECKSDCASCVAPAYWPEACDCGAIERRAERAANISATNQARAMVRKWGDAGFMAVGAPVVVINDIVEALVAQAPDWQPIDGAEEGIIVFVGWEGTGRPAIEGHVREGVWGCLAGQRPCFEFVPFYQKPTHFMPMIYSPPAPPAAEGE